MKQILESIENYAASLEQRLAALEGAASVLQTQLALYQTKTQEQVNVIASLEARIAALEDELDNIEWVNDEDLQPQTEDVSEPVEEPESIVEKTAEEQPIISVSTAYPQPIAPEPEAGEEPAESEPEATVSESIEEEIHAEEEPVKEQAAEEMPAPAAQETPKANLYGKPVDDIKQAIALGDRFLFQRELFKQNAEQMQRTFVDINALHSFDEAVAYLDKRFDWDKDSGTYALFLTALHRRFPQ